VTGNICGATLVAYTSSCNNFPAGCYHDDLSQEEAFR
jgi:hypothetical protein